MEFSPSKCRYMCFGPARLPQPVIFQGYPMTECSNIKDLGLSYTNKLDLSPHADRITAKAVQICGFISYNFYLPEMKLRLYRMFVLPILEYCCPFFGLMTDSSRSKIERIQKQFTRKLLYPTFSSTSYSNRCQLTRLKFLWVRRLEAGFCLLFRLNNSTNLPKCSVLTPVSRPYNLRNSALIIPPPASSSSKRSLFFASRYSFLWNNLPIEIRSLTRMSAFKRRLHTYLNTDSINLLFSSSFPNSFLHDSEKGPTGI